MANPRFWIGILLWSAGLTLGTWWLVGRGADSFLPPAAAESLGRYVLGHRRTVALQVPAESGIEIGDPIFLITGPDSVTRIGEVARGPDEAAATAAQAMFYATAPPLAAGARLVYYETPYSMDWVLQTMLPEPTRREIMRLLEAALREHQQELLQALRPVIDDTLRDAVEVVRQDLPAVVRQRQAEWIRLRDKYQKDVLVEDLLPLLREEVWPILRKHGEPVLNEIGREIWQRASLWRFGWRLAYDSSPLPAKNLAKKEWDRFVEEEAVPVLQAHTEDFVTLQKAIVAEVATNDRVRGVIGENTRKLLEDPELQQLVWSTVREAVVANPRLKAVLEKHWRGPRAQEAFLLASQRLEPTALAIGQLLLGTPETGVTPAFARVLRNRILQKDHRWLVLENGPPGGPCPVPLPGLPVVGGEADNAINPFARESATGLMEVEPMPK